VGGRYAPGTPAECPIPRVSVLATCLTPGGVYPLGTGVT
jgi:hypothetical protein